MEQLIEVLIENYGFELDGETPQAIAVRWLEDYEASWIRLALIEALYLGRYKAISVEQILNLWCRRGQPKFHFTHEFEQLICRRLPKSLRDFSLTVEDRRKISSPASKSPEPEPELEPEAVTEEEEETEPLSINRFTPLLDRSQVYSKLKAVANSEVN
ncbi:hypothetical protein PCC7418_3772 [Halothece sp. PCC 7418]|uniref:hypothetical protein n=1 Tax=Halothece sp. (strain PCC 7418) TaxID=65093 RepID=UPI0002A06E54|nr:hypothetical protein [Halothece sp. PCC 7418]AFZ45876.1 hypothetical protein PCC7418_3772 [Halothece sp. PCC 7418]